MKQIFVLGASYSFGIGAQREGWAGLLKEYLHKKMYSSDGIGDQYELYNFSKPGEPTKFTLNTSRFLLEHYCRNKSAIILVNTGANDSRAANTPTNYLNSLPQFQVELEALITELKKFSDTVLFIGNCPVDEKRTNPKTNPFDGSKSYFTNSRLNEISLSTQRICHNKHIPFIKVNVDKDEWIKNCLFRDGLHPNQKGHQIIFDTVLSYLEQNELL